jgi:acetyl-CoA synthetase
VTTVTPTPSATSATDVFRSARNELLGWRGDYRAAVSGFSWPDVGDRFNWAVDWFDVVARGNDAPALSILEEADEAAGHEPSSWSFDTLRRRSDQVAAWLTQQGVTKGDAVVVMLGNQVELWESMLAIIKLGAVILPTTTAVGPADLRDRIDRGQAKFVLANAADVSKFDDVPGDYGRLAVTRKGPIPDGWEPFDDAYDIDAPPTEHPGTAPSDSTFRRQAGPSTRGPASSLRGTPRRPYSCTTTRDLTRRLCCA